ncbi:MAG: hypothetical protein NT099_10115 [Candidatus Saganbacteria bacterium]|nr:hypothetical protein [Candidatus Saganbacteria bacterium]
MNKIMIGFLSAALFFFVVLFSNPVIAATKEASSPLIEHVGSGAIDWGQATATVKGIGRYADEGTIYYKKQMAKRAAMLDAYRNLAEIIKSIRVDSGTVVENYIIKSDQVQTQVTAYIQNARVTDVQYNDVQKMAELTMVMPLLGKDKLSNIIYPEILPKIESKQEAAEHPNFTGLIVDASGLGIVPAMNPKIIDSNGKELYGTFEIIDPDYVIEYGIIGYAKTLEEAKQIPRIGDKPMIIQGIEAASDKINECDIVVYAADADNVRNANKEDKFLENCQVVIII